MPVKEIVRISVVSLVIGYSCVAVVLLMGLMPFPTI